MDDGSPTRKRRRLVLRGLLAVNAVLLFLPLILVGSFFMPAPTMLRFWNETGAPVSITPVGMSGNGERRSMPVQLGPSPMDLPEVPANLPVPPGQSVDLFFDTSDISFTEIVVEGAGGERGTLVVSSPSDGNHRPPERLAWQFHGFDTLEPVTDEVAAAVVRARGDRLAAAMRRFVGACVLVLVSFCVLAIANRRA